MEGKNGFGRYGAVAAAATLTGNAAAPVLCAVTVLTGKRLIPGWLETVYMLLGGMACVGFLTLFFCFCAPGEEGKRQKLRKYGACVLRQLLWMSAVYFLWNWSEELWRIRGRGIFADDIRHTAVACGLAAVAVLAEGLLLNRMLCGCGVQTRKSGFIQILLTFGAGLLTCALLGAAFFLWEMLREAGRSSAVSMIGTHVFYAFCEYSGLLLLMKAICRGREKDTAEPASADGRGEANPAAAAAGEMPGSLEVCVTGGVSGNPAVSASEASTENMTLSSEILTGNDTDPAVENVKILSENTAKNAAENAVISAAPSPAAPGNAFWKRAAGIGIPLVLTIGAFVAAKGGLPVTSVTEKAADMIEVCIGEGYAALEQGDTEEAVRCFERAEARLQALMSLVSEEAEKSLSSVYGEYPEDTAIGALYLSDTDFAEGFEEGIRNYTLKSEWDPVLLRYYEEQEELSEEQEALRDELLRRCVAEERYEAGSCLFAGDLEEKKLAVLKQIQIYEDELAVCSIFRLAAAFGREGGRTEASVEEALALAEEHPDVLLLQYAAVWSGSNYQEDNAGHYARTMEAAKRFDELYGDEARDPGEAAGVKLFLADAAARCHEDETALAYYEASYELSGDVRTALSCAKIRDRLGQYEECARMASEVLREEPDNGQALYLMALASLKTGDTDAALNAAGRLGDLVADREGPADAALENSLYSCAQYFSMTDNTSWTDYRWEIYDSLNEEQIAAAQSHKLLWDYMTAVRECFRRSDYEAADEAADRILSVRDDLPMAWYIKGTIAFSRKEHEAALTAFKKAEACGSEAPALYFSMANTCEAMEDYENAWLYANKVAEMLPYQDHGNDVYGISVHNARLLAAVEAMLGR